MDWMVDDEFMLAKSTMAMDAAVAFAGAVISVRLPDMKAWSRDVGDVVADTVAVALSRRRASAHAMCAAITPNSNGTTAYDLILPGTSRAIRQTLGIRQSPPQVAKDANQSYANLPALRISGPGDHPMRTLQVQDEPAVALTELSIRWESALASAVSLLG